MTLIVVFNHVAQFVDSLVLKSGTVVQLLELALALVHLEDG